MTLFLFTLGHDALTDRGAVLIFRVEVAFEEQVVPLKSLGFHRVPGISWLQVPQRSKWDVRAYQTYDQRTIRAEDAFAPVVV